MTNYMEKINSYSPVELTTNEIITRYNSLMYGICKNHGGKMEDMQSYSTSCLCNENCLRYVQIEGSVCEGCFSVRQQNRQKNTREKLAYNTDFITKEVLPDACFPMITNMFFRFESFGDLNNEIQFINYLSWVRLNPSVHFAIWTKNPWIMKNVFDMGYEKPENLQIVYSVLMLNDLRFSIESVKEKYWFVDKVFTVLTKKYIKDNNLECIINCGKLKCKECGFTCYLPSDRKEDNERFEIKK